jgi:hypothetical protein
MATLRGEPVDRPPVNFYEIDAVNQDPGNRDPFNIFSDPSWKPVLDLARDHSDRIAMLGAGAYWRAAAPDPCAERTEWQQRVDEQGHRHTTRIVRVDGRELRSRSYRDPDVLTSWQHEHLLKDAADLEAWLSVPETDPSGTVDVSGFLAIEESMGESGIAMLDTADPLCIAADLFDMATFTVVAFTEPRLFRRALDRVAARLYPMVEAVARALPGRLWRVVGPEYACPPYLPPELFEEYVVGYDTPIVEAIQRYGGFARMHCHGRIDAVLERIAATGCLAIDPIEPPPQGDVQLADVRRRVGEQMVLFGNLEASDLENLPEDQFARKVDRALEEGTDGPGRGFVLMPSSCPYGRRVGDRARRNYEVMLERTLAFGGA